MTKNPDQETSDSVDVIKMEGGADTQQITQNGGLEQEENPSKHDDFFDDVPAKQTHSEQDTEEGETKLTNGDVQATENEGTAKDSAEDGEENKQEPDIGHTAEGAAGEAEGGSDDTAAPDPGPPEEDQTEQQNVGDEGQAEHEAGGHGESEGQEKGETTQEEEKPTSEHVAGVEGEDEDQEKEEINQEEEKPASGDTEDTAAQEEVQSGAGGAESLEVGETDRLQPSGQSDYEDDFSQASGNTEAAAAATAEGDEGAITTAAASPDVAGKEVEDTAAVDEAEPQDGGDPQQPSETVAEGEDELIRNDSRAEAAAVVPVVMEDNVKKSDGRSSTGPDEQGELFRGEDRAEEVAPEGSEDCRGQGQWKSEEQQAIAAAMIVHKSEKEALEEALTERDRIRRDYEELKAQVASLEEEADRRSDEVIVNREILARKQKEIADLQDQVDDLQSRSRDGEEEASREKAQRVVKDLQERLAILARENEEKDKRIFKLEGDLKETTTKLRETERKLFAAEAAAGHQEAPKSKTCVVM